MMCPTHPGAQRSASRTSWKHWWPAQKGASGSGSWEARRPEHTEGAYPTAHLQAHPRPQQAASPGGCGRGGHVVLQLARLGGLVPNLLSQPAARRRLPHGPVVHRARLASLWSTPARAGELAGCQATRRGSQGVSRQGGESAC